VLALGGFAPLSEAIYDFYALICHQWAFRSFFLFGSQGVYAREQLELLGLDPYRFVGHDELGWKLALCERDMAIYSGLLASGVWFARMQAREIKPLGLAPYAVLALPIAIDGLSQLGGFRESTWELRVLTGLIFGLASGWLLYPRIAAFVGRERSVGYAAGDACAPQPPRG
jgi:uncharacterized membrane protein